MAEYIEREAAKLCVKEHYDDAIIIALNKLPAADVVPASDFRDCRNELCLRCGKYKTAHLGSCVGCRWRH